MIYTITFNPALDYIVKMNEFNLGHVNRTADELVFAGGKGINVSMVLKNLEVSSKALGFVAGFTGDEIERRVKEFGCTTAEISPEEKNKVSHRGNALRAMRKELLAVYENTCN